MTKYVKLMASSTQESTRDNDPDSKWDGGDSSTSWIINGLELSSKDSSMALPVDEDIKVGDVLYAVYAVYSTGDSFGHDAGAYLELVSLHRDKNLAVQNIKAITNDYKVEGSLQITLDNGEKIKRYCPWDGYFESLDYADFRGMVVT